VFWCEINDVCFDARSMRHGYDFLTQIGLFVCLFVCLFVALFVCSSLYRSVTMLTVVESNENGNNDLQALETCVWKGRHGMMTKAATFIDEFGNQGNDGNDLHYECWMPKEDKGALSRYVLLGWYCLVIYIPVVWKQRKVLNDTPMLCLILLLLRNAHPHWALAPPLPTVNNKGMISSVAAFLVLSIPLVVCSFSCIFLVLLSEHLF